MKPLLFVLALAGCSNPPPECAPRGEAYVICSDDQVWECPAGPADVVAFNVGVDEDCNGQADPMTCLLEAEYQFIEMTLQIDCAGADQVCVEDSGGTGPSTATCEDPP